MSDRSINASYAETLKVLEDHASSFLDDGDLTLAAGHGRGVQTRLDAWHQPDPTAICGHEMPYHHRLTPSAASFIKVQKLDFGDTVTILVGESEQPFTLHKDPLCSHSAHFRAAFEGNFKEAFEQSIRLPDVDLEGFRCYIHWAYSGEVVVLDPEQATEDQQGSRQRLGLINLYIIGDRLSDTLLRNTVINKIIAITRFTKRGFRTETIRLVYAELLPSSKLSKFIADPYVGHGSAAWLSDKRSALPKEFFEDLTIAMKSYQSMEGGLCALDEKGDCTYHDHDFDVPECGAT